MSFSHWVFIIEIATRYVGWFSWINLPPKSFNSKDVREFKFLS